VFWKDAGSDEVFHTYSTFGRGVEVMMGAYRMLDLVPRRDERDTFYKMEWVRHHDRYGPRRGLRAAPRLRRRRRPPEARAAPSGDAAVDAGWSWLAVGGRGRRARAQPGQRLAACRLLAREPGGPRERLAGAAADGARPRRSVGLVAGTARSAWRCDARR
jgi:hypothetical protein